MSKYFRKYELIEKLDIHKTTLSRWLDFFHEYIPRKKIGDIFVFGHESIEVLIRIKNLRETFHSFPTIKIILQEEGFKKYSD